MDRHTIFKAPSNSKFTLDDELEGKTLAYTQFSRSLQELSVGMIYAYSPQAKGLIERLWETLQDRLTLELQSCWYSISWGSKRLPSGIYLTVQCPFCGDPSRAPACLPAFRGTY